MNKTHLVRHSAIAAAVAAALIGISPAYAQTPPPPPDPVVVIEDRALRERTNARDVVLETPLAVQDAAGATILTLPAGTMIGRERLETRFTTPDQPIRERTDLRGVTLQEAVSVTDRSTGNTVELPAGTVIRVKLDQRMDANGNIARDRIDLRAVLPDGTKVRIRDRAPEIDLVDIENEANEVENEAADNHRQRGRDSAKPEGVSGRSVARSERSGRNDGDRGERADRSGRGGGDRLERPERSGRPDRVERAERPDRPERSGRGGSGPG